MSVEMSDECRDECRDGCREMSIGMVAVSMVGWALKMPG
jgi:hypothetical protein